MTPRQWVRSVRVGSSAAKAVLFALADAAGGSKDGSCVLSHATLAARLEISERTVGSAVRHLEAVGAITRARRASTYGHRTSDKIQINFGAVLTEPVAGSQPEAVAGRPGEPTGKPCSAYRQIPQRLPEAIAAPMREVAEELAEVIAIRAAPSARKAARSCPPDWVPGASFYEWAARDLRVSPEVVDAQLAQMRDHEFKKPLKDWDAAARNWMRRAVEYNPRLARGATSGGLGWAAATLLGGGL